MGDAQDILGLEGKATPKVCNQLDFGSIYQIDTFFLFSGKILAGLKETSVFRLCLELLITWIFLTFRGR